MLSMKQKEKIDRSFDGSTRLVDHWRRELHRARSEAVKRLPEPGRRSLAVLDI